MCIFSAKRSFSNVRCGCPPSACAIIPGNFAWQHCWWIAQQVSSFCATNVCLSQFEHSSLNILAKCTAQQKHPALSTCSTDFHLPSFWPGTGRQALTCMACFLVLSGPHSAWKQMWVHCNTDGSGACSTDNLHVFWPVLHCLSLKHPSSSASHKARQQEAWPLQHGRPLRQVPIWVFFMWQPTKWRNGHWWMLTGVDAIENDWYCWWMLMILLIIGATWCRFCCCSKTQSLVQSNTATATTSSCFFSSSKRGKMSCATMGRLGRIANQKLHTSARDVKQHAEAGGFKAAGYRDEYYVPVDIERITKAKGI